MSRFANPEELAAGKHTRESHKRGSQSRGIKTIRLHRPKCAVGELGGDATPPSATHIARRVLATLCKPVIFFLI